MGEERHCGPGIPWGKMRFFPASVQPVICSKCGGFKEFHPQTKTSKTQRMCCRDYARCTWDTWSKSHKIRYIPDSVKHHQKQSETATSGRSMHCSRIHTCINTISFESLHSQWYPHINHIHLNVYQASQFIQPVSMQIFNKCMLQESKYDAIKVALRNTG